jgi:hypothetical protein
MQYLLTFLVGICLFMALLVIKKRRPIEILSPIYIFLICYLIIFIFGWILPPLDPNYGGVSANIALNKYDSLLTLQYGLRICLSFSLGALLNLNILKRKACTEMLLVRLTKFSVLKTKNTNADNVAVFLLCVFTIILVLIGNGITNIWSRMGYLPMELREAKMIGSVLTPIAVISLGYAYLRVGIFGKLLGALAIIGFYLIYFSLASRWFSVISSLFTVGMLMSRPRSNVVRWLVIISILVSFILLIVPLAFRSLEEQGFMPFLVAVHNDASIINLTEINKLLNNLFFSFSLTGHVALYEEIEIKYLFMSFNPIPGSFFNWYDAVGILRVNQHTPFNGPGELLSHGMVVTVLFYFMLGLYFSQLDIKVTFLLSKGKFIFPALVMGLVVTYVVTSLQYNLRSNVRLLLYIPIFQILVYTINEFNSNIKNTFNKSR